MANFGTFDFGTVDIGAGIKAFVQERQRQKQAQRQKTLDDLNIRLSEAKIREIDNRPKIEAMKIQAKKQPDFFKALNEAVTNPSLVSAENQQIRDNIKAQYPNMYKAFNAEEQLMAADRERFKRSNQSSQIGRSALIMTNEQVAEHERTLGTPMTEQQKLDLLARNTSTLNSKAQADRAVTEALFKKSDELMAISSEVKDTVNSGIRDFGRAEEIIDKFGDKLTTGLLGEEELTFKKLGQSVAGILGTLKNKDASEEQMIAASEELDKIFIGQGLGTLKLFGGNDSDKDVALALRRNPQITDSLEMLRLAVKTKVGRLNMVAGMIDIMDKASLDRDMKTREDAIEYKSLVERTRGYGTIGDKSMGFLDWKEDATNKLINKKAQLLQKQDPKLDLETTKEKLKRQFDSLPLKDRIKFETDAINRWSKLTGQK